MNDPAHLAGRSDQSLRLFLACIGVALLVHALTLLLLRDETFFGMAAIHEEARKLFRVPVRDIPPPRPQTQPIQVPDRDEFLAAVQRDVASALSETLATLPPATLVEPPPGSRLEEFAQTREATPAPSRAQAPAHLDALAATTAALGHAAIREEVQVVARRVGAGGATISAATATSLRRQGPTGTAAVMGRPVPPGPRPPALFPPPAALPRRAVRPPPPTPAVQTDAETRRLLDPALAERADSWDAFFDLELSVFRPPTGEPGYFRLDVVPKSGAVLPVAERDVVLVLDASKSMGQDRFAQARQVIADAIRELPPDDRFTVLAFQSRPSWWRVGLQPSTPVNRRVAAAWVSDLTAEGRTDLYKGLGSALSVLGDGARPVVVLLCSDGRPTAGERDSRVLINTLTAQLGGRASIFAYGAGSNVNRYLLDLLAYRNRGAAGFGVRPQDMGPGLSDMERSVREPVYLRPEILVGNAALGSVYPRPLPDIYAGRPTRLWGRLAPGAGHMGIRLLGWSQGRPREILAELPVPPADTGTEALAREWAQQRVLFLVGEITAHGEDPARLTEVARLGRAYGLPEAYVEAARGR